MSQRIQMAVAAVSVALMIFVLARYLREDHRAPPPKPSAPIVLSGTPIATSGDAHPAPLDVYATAKLGDWYAYTYVTTSTLGTFHSTVVVTVRDASDTSVTTSLRGRIRETGDTRDSTVEPFPRTGLTLERLVGHDISGWTILAASVADDDHAIDDRTFHAKKVTYTSKDPMFATKTTTTELWLSSEVPGGLVEEHEVQDVPDRGLHFDMTKTLIGFGTATATTWGTKPAF